MSERSFPVERNLSRMSGISFFFLICFFYNYLDRSGLNYESEAGGSLFSVSTAVSRNQAAAGRTRIDLGVGTSGHRNIRIDHPQDLLNSSVDCMEFDDANGNTGDGSKLLIWGTRICVEDVQKAFYNFITTFCAEEVDDDENAIFSSTGERMEINLSGPLYMENLRGISLSEVPILNLNLAHVRHFNEALYKNIIAYPAVSSYFIYV